MAHTPSPQQHSGGSQFPTEEARRGLTEWVDHHPESPVAQLKQEMAALREEYRDLQEQLAEERGRYAGSAAANDLMAVAAQVMREFMEASREFRQQRAEWLQERPAVALLPQPTQAPLPEIEAAAEDHDPVPRIKEWRLYRGFRTDMQHREQVMRDAATAADRIPTVSPDALSGHRGGGDSRKSIERRMRHFHLDPKTDWPPSTWPEDEPRGPVPAC